MIQAFFLAIGQLMDRRIAGVFLKSLALTLALFAVLGAALWLGMHRALAAMFGGGEGSGTAADILIIVLLLFAHWLLFRAIAIGVIDIFGDEVVEAVEARHYPGALSQVRRVPFARSVRMGLGSAGRAIGLNILFSPVYLIANVAAPFVFFIVNAWLLGRDLGDMVAARHMAVEELPAWRRRTRLQRYGVGMIGTGLLLVPVVNLLAPVLSAAMAAHVFHRGSRK